MAVAKFIDDDDYTLTISRAITAFPELADKTLRVGADIIADEVKRRIQQVLLPFSRNGELIHSFGITPMKRDGNGNYNVSVGFGGYRQPPYGKFPNGVPFQLIARSFESGAVTGSRYTINYTSGKRKKLSASEMKGKYWREPTHFMTKAIRASRQKALGAMEEYAEKQLNELSTKRT